MKSITVFTPTFNRAYCLHQIYDSLVYQTNQDFTWLIIDDGSTDNTKQLVDSWKSENKISIEYIFQENKGMHGGHNTAYDNIKTELNVCIDSDDFMTNDAVENILLVWKNTNDKSNIAGIIGLDSYKNGEIVGTKIPENITRSGLSKLYFQYGVSGDKKIVLRTDIVNLFPRYPIFEGEKFVPLGTLYTMIDQKYECICINKVLCVVEYLTDGSSLNIFNQYRKHPNGFRYSRIIEMQNSHKWSYTFTRALHFISSSIFTKKFNFFQNNPAKLTTLIALPFGLLLHLYILLKIKK